MEADEIRFNMRMKRDLYERLERFKEGTGRSVADVLRQMAVEFIEERENGGWLRWSMVREKDLSARLDRMQEQLRLLLERT